MSPSEQTVEYREAGCIFRYDKEKKVLRVEGPPKSAKKTILQLYRERWLPRSIRAIWFQGDVAQLVVGRHLQMYLANVKTVEPPKPPMKAFKDFISTH